MLSKEIKRTCQKQTSSELSEDKMCCFYCLYEAFTKEKGRECLTSKNEIKKTTTLKEITHIRKCKKRLDQSEQLIL